jgi:glycosyltransferase involved in cell wall biosynthesis
VVFHLQSGEDRVLPKTLNSPGGSWVLPGFGFKEFGGFEMISIVVCTYNGSLKLENTLASIGRLSTAPEVSWELVVVDNGSLDNTAHIVGRFAATSGVSVRYLFEPKQGKSFALNTGLRAAHGELLAFTDDDVLVDQHWLTGLVRVFAQFDCIGVAGRVVPIWWQRKPQWLELDGQQAVVHFEYGEAPRMLDFPPIGANMAFRRIAFEKYGLFREDLGRIKNVSGIEDREFGGRLLSAGEKIVYAPQAIIYHPVEPARLRKSYVLRWAYSVGRQQIRSRSWPQDVIRYFGIPRYLFGSLLRSSFRWAVSRDKKRRFQHQLHFYRALGSISEGLLHRSSQHGVPLSQLSSGGQTMEATTAGIRLSRPGQLEDFPDSAGSHTTAPPSPLSIQ